MSSYRNLRKKEFNQLLTLGTVILSNKDLIKFAAELREKYKINIVDKETDPEHYRKKLEKKGTIDALKQDVEEYFRRQQAEDKEAPALGRKVSKIYNVIKDEKAKDHFDTLWDLIIKPLKQIIKDSFGDLTINEVMNKYGFETLFGNIANDSFVEYVITGEFQNFPEKFSGTILDGKEVIIAIATPLTIQELMQEDFKRAMRKKFPKSFKTMDDCVAAACLALRNMGFSNKEIALKVYDISPSRRDFEAELKRKENLVTKKIKKIDEQLDIRFRKSKLPILSDYKSS